MYLGCDWIEAHHPWSRDSRTYTSSELLEHLVKAVIPLSKKNKVPKDAPFELPKTQDLPVLGAKTTDLKDYSKSLESTKLESMLQALKERE